MTSPNTATDTIARLAEHDLDDMVEKIVRAYDESQTPSDLRERFSGFARDHQQHVQRLDAALLGTMAWWLTKGHEAGYDRDVLDQVCLQSAQRAIAIIARAMKARQGLPFDPARVAIVAFMIASDVAAAPDFKADLEGATAALDDAAHEVATEGLGQ